MKLSKREKVLIFILIIALIGYAAYKLLPGTELFNLEALKEEHNQKSDVYSTMSQNILLGTKYEEKVQTLSDEINNLNVISDIQQENIIVFLNNYFANNNIDANSISFTDATVVPMSDIASPGEPKVKSTLEELMEDINKASGAENSEQVSSSGNTAVSSDSEPAQSSEQQPSLMVRSISVNAAFESTYNDMIKFIDAIKNNLVDISITNINTVSTESGVLQGIMTLNFYEIPKPEGFVEDNDDWIWKNVVKSGKSNPFSSDGVALPASTGSSYDFYMSVVPESSDLPTVMLGKAGDTERATYVYADSNLVENITLSFKKENEKYYYKYSTKNSTYPSGGGWTEFTPSSSGSINIKIYSSMRNSKTDSAGANISVANTSGLKIKVDIEDDDSSTPRIFFKQPREVAVIRK